VRVALVAPYFGRDLRGRKERFAFAYATHLGLEGLAVEVLTTTTTAEASDENFYRAGRDHTEPFPVYRFRVTAPDRVAYEEAVIAAAREDPAFVEPSPPLLDERLRCPDLLAQVRASGDRYDAFLFVDVSVPTTVRAIAEVAERSLLVPLLDDEPVVRLPEVVEAVARARTILCTTDAEMRLVAQLFGPEARSRSRVIGSAVDTVPLDELHAERVRRITRGRPYVLLAGNFAAADVPAGGDLSIVRLDAVDESDRAAFFAFAAAVAIAGEGRAFAPEVTEAWAYGKAVLCAANARGVAARVRETGGGIVVPEDGWEAALRSLPDAEQLAALGARGHDDVLARGGWPRVAERTRDAIDVIAAQDDGRSRDALLAHVAFLYPLVQRQRRTIDAMRTSRFWQLRDRWFALRRRFRIGPLQDPVPIPDTENRAIKLASLGDPYQLYRQHHRLRPADADRVGAMARLLPRTVSFAVVVDGRAGSDGIAATLRSLQDQLYIVWSVRLLAPASDEGALAGLAPDDPRINVIAPGGAWFGDEDFVVPLAPGDRLEPHALFACALAAQDEVDVIYSDEDRLDEHGVARAPWFKPDWSPETLLTRDYVGRMCAMRRTLLERSGGVRDVFETARWYEALLRVTESTERVAHVAEVLCHRGPNGSVERTDLALAVEVALQRRGEAATVSPLGPGVEVRFAVPGDERVCVIVPTRDRADLLRPCIASVFERTAYAAFEMIVIDNGSRDRATHELLAEWKQREPTRFRVIADPSPFNYSRLNNQAVRATDAPYVLLLNNDTEVIAPGWMEAMLGQARRERIGAVGGLLLYADGTVQHAGVVLGILDLSGHAHRSLPADGPGYHGALQLDTNYVAVTGACLMVARRTYDEVGGLDETMAVAFNDIDFCLKLHRAGYRNVVVPRARLYHYESKSRGEVDTLAKITRAMEEGEALRARWPRESRRDPFYNPNLTVDAEDFGLRL